MGKKVKQHVEGRSKAERKTIRANLGPLKGLTVQPKTKDRYNKAVQKFLSWTNNHGVTLPQQRCEMDHILADYLEYMWTEGEGRSLAADTVAGLQDRDPHLKGHLVISWRLLKTWASHEIPCRAPPLTEEALHTLVGHALFHSRATFALSLLLGFHGLLRTGELLELKGKDVSQASSTSVAVISLGLTKGGQRTGAAESVTITEADTLRRLWQWKQAISPGTKLCDAPHKWRKMFQTTVEALGLEQYQYRPYSLRRGGATFYFQRHGQLDRLLLQGRWQSSKTARLYINSGLAILAETELNLAPHARMFHKQFLRTKSLPLPQLEHAIHGRAGGSGRTNSTRRQKRKNKENTEFGVGGLVVPRFGGAQHYPRSLAHVYLG